MKRWWNINWHQLCFAKIKQIDGFALCHITTMSSFHSYCTRTRTHTWWWKHQEAWGSVHLYCYPETCLQCQFKYSFSGLSCPTWPTNSAFVSKWRTRRGLNVSQGFWKRGAFFECLKSVGHGHGDHLLLFSFGACCWTVLRFVLIAVVQTGERANKVHKPPKLGLGAWTVHQHLSNNYVA